MKKFKKKQKKNKQKTPTTSYFPEAEIQPDLSRRAGVTLWLQGTKSLGNREYSGALPS